MAAPLRAGLLVLLVCLVGQAAAKRGPGQQKSSLEKLFRTIDTDADGEVSALEAEKYAAAALDMPSEGWSATEAALVGRGTLDGPDEGDGVTAAELAQHLRALLQDHRVVEWVAHGLNLPQYAAAFKRNAITALDFPFLVADGGAALQADLGVTSRLHQQQILRGLKRLILGLGKMPAAPLQLACTALNKTAVLLTWQAPPTPGHPAFHKYVLQRQRVTPPDAAAALAAQLGGGSDDCPASPLGGMCAVEERWEAAGEADDEDNSWVDSPPAKGAYRYRLAAWSAFGHSEYALSAGSCTVRAVQKQHRQQAAAAAAAAGGGSAVQMLAPAEMQALLAAVAAAGGNLSAKQLAGAAGSTGASSGWSWSAASSAVVVALSILLKASQLRLGAMTGALWRSVRASISGHEQAPAEGCTAGPAPGGRTTEGMAAEQAGASAGGRAGLRRTNTSHASLASLGDSERAVEDLLLSGSSSQQLLGGGEASRRFGGSSMQLDGLEVDPAAGALAEAAEDDAAAEQLQQAILRGARCAHPGCHRRFDRLRDMRRRLESHYCALCQRMYCLHHTRISPHGPRGGCGLESKCACYTCFAELAPAQQASYERINRLPKPGSCVGGTSGAAAAAASMAQAALGCANGFEQSAAASPEKLHNGVAGGAAACADSPPTSGTVSPQQSSRPGSPSGQAAPTEAAAAAPSSRGGGAAADATGSAARHRWRKAGKVLLALARFKAAGSAPTSPQRHV